MGYTQPGDDIHTSPWKIDGPYIEIDGLPNLNMVDLSMATRMLNKFK